MSLYLDLAWPPMFALMWMSMTGRRPRLLALAMGWTAAATGCLVGALMTEDWAHAAISAGQVLVGFLLYWWHRRKNRLRSLLQWGQRELARLASMVRALRDAAPPQPALAPGGTS